ncbi:CPBP family intramembrane glutamic endopeptidase [Exiguobacterium flavidum]|uniref:CPBP family intramembrane glutamic endopeptidase n=1 Tax=Exiguobacterium flavidum TaxID=2184695 RepID=UPI0013003E16|nr:CPBP family intramembrane glutamic endopeptidase [Exiguobacterium flavidum]
MEKAIYGLILLILAALPYLSSRVMMPELIRIGRPQLYLEMVKSSWILMFGVVLTSLLFGTRPAELGLVFWSTETDLLTFGCVMGANILLYFLFIRSRKSDRIKKMLRPLFSSEAERALLPRNEDERRSWRAVAWTAGVTEEAIYRGFWLYAAPLLLPAPSAIHLILMGIVFGMAHAYQGKSAIFVTGAMGIGFGFLYVKLQILWPLMLLHALLDLLPTFVHNEKTTNQ